MSDVIVERQWPEPLANADMLEMTALAETCLDIHRISWSSSFLSAPRHTRTRRRCTTRSSTAAPS